MCFLLVGLLALEVDFVQIVAVVSLQKGSAISPHSAGSGAPLNGNPIMM